MATVVLQYAGAAIGTALGGPLGGMIGRAAGALAGNVIDQKLFGAQNHHEGPRLSELRVMASEEGAAIPVVFGRMRVGGQVIWAAAVEEVASTTTQKTSSKGGPKATTTDYSYFASFAVGLCEGEIAGLGRVWADGKEIDISAHQQRLYTGSETQNADSLIVGTDGTSPAYRGLAYIVFERLPLAKFSNRLPQLSFEVIRRASDFADVIRGVNIIPGAGEFVYDTQVVTRQAGLGKTATENAHVSTIKSDWSISLDQLQQQCPNVQTASLVVAWFGTDLRCGQCQIMPGADNATKQTAPSLWTVNGIARAAAHAITLSGGQPAYGGTPSDASVVRAIQDLKARGLKVVFYPFVLMDIAAGNALPDPYGGAAQATYPWRGRITTAIAPGRAGTSDKTAAAASEVSGFVGTAQPGHFTPLGQTVNYSGPAEWSFRRMILHYAKLCALAGGVDAFLIGSEFPGLSTVRSNASTYPFVAALQTLATQVKTILPGSKISYAADWSEYNGHRPADGSNDVYFHLDPLWSSSAIDFIGVDNYLPLADWRGGTTHLDFVGGTRSLYDLNYLKANIAGGEYYDWYYASAAARQSQTRTAISDGAYNKPWVFRPKDFKNWWANSHYNRPGGVESPTPTAWVAQSKPIWFTELGCPAIDKGPNQPNVFVDAKSAESATPWFSSGQSDDAAQAAYGMAMQSYWEAGGAANPTSSVYGASMVDPSRLIFWAWDARPFPSFPSFTSVWSDGANYQLGHWLNGRTTQVDLARLIREVSQRFGFGDVDVSSVEGRVDGFVIDRPLSARDALEGLLQVFAIEAVESEGKLKFRSRRTLSATTIADADMVDESAKAVVFQRSRKQETDIPAAVKMTYVESGLDYRSAAVSTQRPNTASAREIVLNVPAALNAQLAQARADVALAETWSARETAKFTLPPSWEAVEPADVIVLNGNRWRVTSVMQGVARKIEAVLHEAGLYETASSPARIVPPFLPAIYGPPEFAMMDLPMVAQGQSTAPWLAAQSSPFPPSLALFKQSGGASYVYNRSVSKQATFGETLNPLPAGKPGRLDFGATLDVKLHFGALQSVSALELVNGANLAAVGSADLGHEVIQFRNATLIAADTYRMTGLLRGQGGSEPEMLGSRAAGAQFILLNAAVVQPDITLSDSFASTWRLGPSPLDHGDPAYANFNYAGTVKALRPLSPAQIKFVKSATGYAVSWIRRTRVDGDSWDLAEVPLGETGESYRLDILSGSTLKRSITLSQPGYFYLAADATADFGANPVITLRVAQFSSAVGAGPYLERTFNG